MSPWPVCGHFAYCIGHILCRFSSLRFIEEYAGVVLVDTGFFRVCLWWQWLLWIAHFFFYLANLIILECWCFKLKQEWIYLFGVGALMSFFIIHYIIVSILWIFISLKWDVIVYAYFSVHWIVVATLFLLCLLVDKFCFTHPFPKLPFCACLLSVMPWGWP